jgi:putative holliday junction resolvase
VGEVLAIDWGSKRMGLAIGNTEARIAKPFETWENTPQFLKRLGKLCHQQNIKTVVVGYPRNLDGGATAQSHQVKNWTKELKKVISCKVVMQDESLTTPAKATANRDAEAAAVILQDYLDGL